MTPDTIARIIDPRAFDPDQPREPMGRAKRRAERRLTARNKAQQILSLRPQHERT